MKIIRFILQLARYPNVVCIMSSMRSGSTLLKSLIATAPDTSDLPEINFIEYKWYNRWKINLLSKADIIVMKYPRAFHHIKYPVLPKIGGLKKIFLVRDVFGTVQSLDKMLRLPNVTIDKKWTLKELANTYWYETNANLIKLLEENGNDLLLVRYEDLISNPIATTKIVFEFIGSKQLKGVDTYSKPENYEWKWGSDDGGELIKSLKVQRSIKGDVISEEIKNLELEQKTKDLRTKLGYFD